MLGLEAEAWAVLAATVFVAGLVRGFAGFGTGMIYMPVASQILSPTWALVTLVIIDLIGPLPNLPRALRDGYPRDMVFLMAGLIVGMPLGIYVLSQLPAELFRYGVSVTALILLGLLLSGLRYKGVLTRPILGATGGLGGFLAGSTGLPGPPVIMLYMASTHAASAVRANLLLFMFLSDIMMLLMFGGYGLLSWMPVQIGLVLAVPYIIGNVIGAALFDPAREVLYRRVAYAIIAVTAVSGLPIWD